jgi:hypothetical protein
MRLRHMIGATVVAAVVLVGCVGTAAANVTKVCTWGGTPLAPTGESNQYPGVTNAPSPVPMYFRASAPLGGDCHGTLTFDGVEDTGSMCSLITFHGRAYGLPGVSTFAGVAVAGGSPGRLYDKYGNLVGQEDTQFLTNSDAVSECGSPEGLTHNNFSTVIELFDNYDPLD